jgi:hypothetical protein
MVNCDEKILNCFFNSTFYVRSTQSIDVLNDKKIKMKNPIFVKTLSVQLSHVPTRLSHDNHGHESV